MGNGQRRMSSTRKEEPKLSYKYSTNRRNQKQARNTFHFRNINVKKTNFLSLFRYKTKRYGEEERMRGERAESIGNLRLRFAAFSEHVYRAQVHTT